MKVELLLTPTPLTDARIRNKTVIVIDILRASTSICTAIRNGCREVIPVATLGDATTMRSNLDRELVLMCGERDGVKVEGFDLGNSPSEYTEDVIHDKILIFCSTNGSGAIASCVSAQQVIICGFVNISAAVKLAVGNNRDITIVCAGTKGEFSLEDTLCGGMFAQRLLDSGNYELLNDAARVAHLLYNRHDGSIEDAVSRSDHACYLASLGAGSDIGIAAAIDSCPVVPVLNGGKLVAANQPTT